MSLTINSVANMGLDTDLIKNLYGGSDSFSSSKSNLVSLVDSAVNSSSSLSDSTSSLYSIIQEYYTSSYFQIKFYDEYIESLQQQAAADEAAIAELIQVHLILNRMTLRIQRSTSQ